MNIKIKTILFVSAAAFASSALVGCGSGDAEVDQKAMDARNAQRGGASGAPPASGQTAGATAGATAGQ